MFKQIARCLACALFVFATTQAPAQQPYPNRPIHVIFGFPPGTVLDTTVRLLASDLEKRLGQPLILEFKPGANGTIAAKYVVNSAPDGYTLLYTNAMPIHPLQNENNAVDVSKDMEPVSHFTSSPYWLLARGDLPAKTIAELAAYAKSQPEAKQLTFGRSSPTIDVIMDLLAQRTGIAARSIPYKASTEITTALVAGQIDLAPSNVQAMLPFIRQGKVKALLVASPKRSKLLPDVPTSTEQGLANFDMSQNYGMWAPRGTPKDIRDRLSKAVNEAINSPALAQQVRDMTGAEPIGSTPEEQLRTMEAELKFWTEAQKLSKRSK